MTREIAAPYDRYLSGRGEVAGEHDREAVEAEPLAQGVELDGHGGADDRSIDAGFRERAAPARAGPTRPDRP